MSRLRKREFYRAARTGCRGFQYLEIRGLGRNSKESERASSEVGRKGGELCPGRLKTKCF